MKNLQLKKHALTAISYMLPLIVASGLLIAIGNLTGGQVIEDYNGQYSIWDAIVSLGVLGMGIVAPVMAAGISYSIADRPGIAPGLMMGLIANAIGAGFFGAMLGGFAVGYFIVFLKRVLKVPSWAESLLPMMILPLVSSLVIGLLMFFVIGVPIVWATNALTELLTSMSDGSNALFGAVFGGMVAFDYGGPVNKTASLFADGLMLNGIFGPEAVKVGASMVPPFGIGIAYLINKKKFTSKERDELKTAIPLGVCMITEGVLPMVAVDPIRIVISTTLGAMVTGAIIMIVGVGSPVPSGGLFIVPAMTDPIWFLIALGAGSLVTGLILATIKKEVKEEDLEKLEGQEEEVDLSNIVIEEN